MKILRVIANNFKNCDDNFTIDLLAKSKKTESDKLYELSELADELFTFNTVAFVGKNASGKTTAIQLLDLAETILSRFNLSRLSYGLNNVELEIVFHHKVDDVPYIFRYLTKILPDENLPNNYYFEDEKLYRKKYYKSKLKEIFDNESFEEVFSENRLPRETSKVYNVIGSSSLSSLFVGTDAFFKSSYDESLYLLNIINYDELLSKIINIFDQNVLEFKKEGEDIFNVKLSNGSRLMRSEELFTFLSKGTTKGIYLYTLAVVSLKLGIDLIVDEIENHFHKTLVENIISLFKDKKINKKSARLIFTTHYVETLDLFGRQDNIYICRASEKNKLQNMYEHYKTRSELSKSNLFYSNFYDTNVKYDSLMNLRRELRK